MSVTEPPAQNVVGPPAAMLAEAVLIVTVTGAEAADVQPPAVYVTV